MGKLSAAHGSEFVKNEELVVGFTDKGGDSIMLLNDVTNLGLVDVISAGEGYEGEGPLFRFVYLLPKEARKLGRYLIEQAFAAERAQDDEDDYDRDVSPPNFDGRF